ncbi:ThiF family adenylyltransferase [Bacillus marinisedimentorum]|uniref:ThiF family adenylyltransferase n=1 Tax=Bacillus marinisedimentorum TaxID=1821260 RepID=UPI000AB4C78F|nr:ThiF family adenylyltransferase [Bacillus marinisedimentorum]
MNSEMERYSRQILFQPIGEEGQQKLMKSRAAVVGMGALGTVIANHLVRAGVGFVRIIDRDFVEKSNLQRQTLFDEDDAADRLPKVIAAEKKLARINSTVSVDPVLADLNPDNAEELLKGFDVIVDGTDNFMTRYLINDAAIKFNTPWIYGGAVSSRGMFAVIVPEETPCYRCLFPDLPSGLGETCDTIGVISPITDIIGSFEAVEALKLLTGARPSPNLEKFEIWHNSFFQMDISQGRNPDCPACVHHHYEFLDQSESSQENYTALCGRDTVQINPRTKLNVNLEKTARRLDKAGKTETTPFLVRFSPDDRITMIFFKDGRVLVQGVEDVTEAKSYYSRYAGN